MTGRAPTTKNSPSTRTRSTEADSIPTPPDLSGLRRTLRSWYRRHRRDLPWRRTNDPYAILVSEFMLQQTQVATVLPYYARFLKRFPTLESLAGAPDPEVRAAWSGLGYYRRARNLQAAARAVVRDHAGALPADLDALRALPGVGDYTAAALGSMVHGLPRAVVDGNVVRVLTRLTACDESVSRASTRRALQDLADRILDPKEPGDWNQAVMELGARVCTPRSPDCGSCPWSRSCRARAAGNPERHPRKDASTKPVTVERAVGVVRRGDRVLLVHRRDPKLLDGTWEFPGIDLDRTADPRTVLHGHLTGVLRKRLRVGPELARVRHSITHRRITVRAFAVHVDPLPRTRKDERAWVAAGEIAGYPASSMTLKLMKELVPLLARA
jgi:A/G-specific adenine glycosylase